MPQTPGVRKGGQGHTTPSEWDLPLDASLPWLAFPVLQVPNTGTLQNLLPPKQTVRPGVTVNSPRLFWGQIIREDRKEGQGDQGTFSSDWAQL